MACETKTKVINGHNYSVTQMPGREALKVKTKLASIIGPSLGSVGVVNGQPDIDIGKAVSLLVERLDENQFEALILRLFNGTTRDGADVNSAMIDLEYSGNLSEMYKAIGFVLEVNYGDFFGTGGFGGLMTKVEGLMSQNTENTSALNSGKR